MSLELPRGLVPYNNQQRDARLVLINTAIALFGVFVLDWSLGQIVILFFLELMLLGGFTVLKIIFAQEGKPSFWTSFLSRLFTAAMFTVGFILVNTMFIVFVTTSLNFDTLFGNTDSIRLGQGMLILNFVAAFLFGYILNGTYKNAQVGPQFIGTLGYMLPLIGIFLIVIKPNLAYFGEENINRVAVVGIILAKLLLELATLWFKKAIAQKVLSAKF